jgi:hypothetical protein
MTDYNSIYKGESKDEAAIPQDGEMSYGAFVSALIKVSNLQKLMEEKEDTKNKPASQVVFKEYGEY